MPEPPEMLEIPEQVTQVHQNARSTIGVQRLLILHATTPIRVTAATAARRTMEIIAASPAPHEAGGCTSKIG